VVDLLATLDDEHLAHATYVQVIAGFGEGLPFTNIVEAEGRRIDALIGLLRRHEVEVPDNSRPDKVALHESVTEACRTGVGAETDNAML